MPVGLRSRYRSLAVVVAADAAGVPHATIGTRTTPAGPPASAPYFHTVLAGETIEGLSAHYLGSSEAWWMIADANPVSFPAALVPGTRMRIPTDASPGRIERTRSF